MPAPAMITFMPFSWNAPTDAFVIGLDRDVARHAAARPRRPARIGRIVPDPGLRSEGPAAPAGGR